jgi:hypothetical protein
MKEVDYYLCPGCGREVRVGSQGCPQCNQLDPWEQDDTEIYDGLDLPDDKFDYQQFLKNEFGDKKINTNGLSLFWWIVAIILLIALIFQMLIL